MEPFSLLRIVKEFVSLLLKKIGYKFVKLDEYKDETVEVDLNYPDASEICKTEKNKGAKFYWSAKYISGYEKYFEITENIRRYFKCRNQILWIKK